MPSRVGCDDRAWDKAAVLAAARRIPADSPICNGQRSLTGAMISGIEWSVMAPVRAAYPQDLPNRTHGETGCVRLCRSFSRLFVCLFASEKPEPEWG